jgi:NAD(P)-dependent dehydrogenase (short-subunit alcohol dehydrogenase family)
MVAMTAATLSRLDILINNAGIGRGQRPEEFPLADWNSVLATNLTGAFIAAQPAYLVLRFRNNVPMVVKPHHRFCSAKCGPLARD